MGPAEEMQLSTKQTHYESPSCTALKHLAEATRAAGKATALQLAAQRPACNIGQQLHATSSRWAEPLWTQLSHFSQHVISVPQPQASTQLRQGSGWSQVLNAVRFACYLQTCAVVFCHTLANRNLYSPASPMLPRPAQGASAPQQSRARPVSAP